MTIDMTAYEQMRAERHEELARMTASLVNIPYGVCHLRQCRRRRTCSGPMVPSPHQAGQVEVQRMLGMSGKAAAALPLCAAHLDPENYALFRQSMTEFEATTRDQRAYICWRAIRLSLSGRRQRPLTSAADHPTSGGKPGGDAP